MEYVQKLQLQKHLQPQLMEMNRQHATTTVYTYTITVIMCYGIQIQLECMSLYATQRLRKSNWFLAFLSAWYKEWC